MVVPQLYENAASARVWKPPGLWFNLRNGSALEDGGEVATNWSDHVVTFVRGGSVVFEFVNHSLTVAGTFRHNLRAYIAFNETGESSGSVYFDDLISMNHTSGDFVRIEVFCNLSYLTIRRVGPYVYNSSLEHILLYGASSYPTFSIPGALVTFSDGVYCITGISLSLTQDYAFGAAPSPAPSPTPATSPHATETPIETPAETPAETPGETPAETASPNPSSNTGKIIGIAVGCSIGGIIIIAIIAVLICRRRRPAADPESLLSRKLAM
jgi:hypothetical protein